jgi:predicted regulator of amino acid metabolism with ACT domain
MNHSHIRIAKPSPDEHEDFSDKIAEVMAELSMGYVIMYVGKDVGWLYIQLLPSEDGTTNITADVIQAIIDKMTPATQTRNEVTK